MKLTELDKQEFAEFSENNPQALFFQTPYWIEIKEQNNWSGKIVGFKENGEIIAATVLLFKKTPGLNAKLAYAPRGFLLDYSNFPLLEEFTKEIKQYLKTQNAFCLKINPYVDYQLRDIDGNAIEGTKQDALMDKLRELGFIHNGFYVDQDSKSDLEPRWISVLDIDGKSFDELYKNMRSGTKWGINNSKKNFITILEADEKQLFEFKDLMVHTAERRGFIDRPLSYYQEMYKVLKRENAVKVLLAEIDFKALLDFSQEKFDKNSNRLSVIKDNPKKAKEAAEIEFEQGCLTERIGTLKENISEFGEKKVIAGGWYIMHGKEIVYLFGASYKPFMKYNSQYLLQQVMIEYAIANGYGKFNFYGIDGNFDKNSKHFGLFDFKRGFGAVVHELVGEFDLIISKPTYTLYKLMLKGYKVLKFIQKKI
ncbi:MAG: peptidoglycan bridge formation glycyltransferase FemA/FemB family protein [Oscillospiraceae bacterium]|nr:peptidoglycan bridge formation glycyltransferase FemA/FemB family protein [Oscillospiraceae bacterium]